jgi:hypothetical protein
MAQPNGGGADSAFLSGQLISGSFAAAGQSAVAVFYGSFNISLWGTFVGTVRLERSFDGGTTWLPLSVDLAGTNLQWTQPYSGYPWAEVEHTVPYRLNCTAYTSGTVNYRMSQTSDVVWVGGTSR